MTAAASSGRGYPCSSSVELQGGSEVCGNLPVKHLNIYIKKTLDVLFLNLNIKHTKPKAQI